MLTLRRAQGERTNVNAIKRKPPLDFFAELTIYTSAACPWIGKGTRVTTRLGDFWVTRNLFSGDYFIHAHVTELREGCLHRMLDRLYKPFGMAYTRLETRSAYHTGFGPRTGQLVARAVFRRAPSRYPDGVSARRAG